MSAQMIEGNLLYMHIKFQINRFIGSEDIMPNSLENVDSSKAISRFNVQCDSLYKDQFKITQHCQFLEFRYNFYSAILLTLQTLTLK